MHTGISVVDHLPTFFRQVFERPHQREREDLLMAIAEQLASGVDLLTKKASDDDATIVTLNTEIDQLKAAPQATGGLTQDQAQALLNKIQAIVGPVPDPTAGAAPTS